ncbi:MAG: sigma-70 family RNA polymerase sigma factor [Pirellulales bacterium]
MASDSSALRLRLHGGDQHALAELFSLQRDRLWRTVHFRLDRRLAGRVDADDVLQEAFLAATARIHHYLEDPAVSMFVWLRAIVMQTLIDVHRRHIGAQMRDAGREISIHSPFTLATSVSLAAQLLGRFTSPSQAAIRAELAAQLESVLENLNPIDQEIVALRHFEELTNTEVAEVLGLTQKAASIRYIRALTRMKEILAHMPGFIDSEVSTAGTPPPNLS